MKRKFFTSLTFLLFLNLLIKPFWIFGIDRTVQNVVGAEQYGTYFALFNFSVLFSIFLDLGLTNFSNRHISQNEQLVNKSLSHILVLRLLLAMIYAALVLGVGYFLNYSTWQMQMLSWLVVNQFLLAFVLYLRSVIAGLQFFRADAIVSVLDRSVMIVLCGLLLWLPGIAGFRIEWFVWAQTVSYTLTLLVAFIIVVKQTGSIKLRLNLAHLRLFLKKGAPFALLTLLMSVYYRIDSVMLERLLPNGQQEAGVYAQGFRILDAFGMLALLFSTLLLPMFSKMLGKREDVRELLRFAFLLLLTPILAFVLLASFHSHWFMDLLYTHHIDQASNVFRILILCLAGVSASYILGTLLTANGNLRLLNRIAAVGVVVNVLLNLVVIPRWGAIGAAWASLATQLVVVASQTMAVQKQFASPFSVFLFGKILLYTMSLLLLNKFAHMLPLAEWLLILLVAAVSGALVFVFGFVQFSFLRRLFSDLIK